MANLLCLLSLIHLLSIGVVSTDDSIEHRLPSTRATCPQNCTCTITTSLIDVDCGGNHSYGIEGKLSAVITEHPEVTKLQLENSDISQLDLLDLSPLKALTYFRMESIGRVTQVPDSFFRSNIKLTNIIMINSRIRELSAALFRGLDQLQNADFTSGEITHIDPETFTQLPAIQYVTLERNKLREIDIWPLFLMVKHHRDIGINLRRNFITNFTNHINWTFHHGMRAPYGSLDMKYNKVHHIADIRDGYKFVGPYAELNMLLLFANNTFHINLQENELVCDCIDIAFHRFIHNNKNMRTLTCHSSPNEALVGQLLSSIPLDQLVCDIHGGCPSECSCLQEPYNRTLHINCQGQGLSRVPDSIPQYKNMTGYKHKLNMQNNQLTVLSPRRYFETLVQADFAGNFIDRVELDAIKQLANSSQHIYLDTNNIQRLPAEIQDVDLSHVTSLTLHSNPWLCDCERKWLLSWMTRNKNKTVQPDSILCDSPSWNHKKNIFALTEDQFCDDPEKDRIKEIVMFSVSFGVGALLFLVFPVVFIYTKRVWIYKKFQFHPFDWDECEGEDKQYDVFISHADENEDFVRSLVKDLEKNGFKIKVPSRDFLPGDPVNVCMEEAIDSSKRTICVLSPEFIANENCKSYFNTALSMCLQTKGSRLIVIRLQDIPESNLPKCVALYLRFQKYIVVDSGKKFMDHLLYRLPVRRLGQPPTSGSTIQEPDSAPLLS